MADRTALIERKTEMPLPHRVIITGIYREKGRLVVRKFEQQDISLNLYTLLAGILGRRFLIQYLQQQIGNNSSLGTYAEHFTSTLQSISARYSNYENYTEVPTLVS